MKVLMRERGVSNNALAGKVGVSEATIRQAINLGVGRLGADTIYKIARELGATVESLLEEPDLHSGGQALDRLPVRYRVGGGAWVEVDDYAQGDYGAIEISPDPRFPFNMQWLEQVEGDSMNRIYPEGTYLHVVDAIYLGYEPKEGDVVIVERSRDGGLLKERSAKQVHVRRGGIDLWPRSTNPRWKTAITIDDHASDETSEVTISGRVLRGFIENKNL